MTAARRNAEVPPIQVMLRQATGDLHKAVEKQTPFFRPGFDRREYAKWLDLMHGFYLQADRAVDESSFAAATGWQYVPRCNLIARDLQLVVARAPDAPPDRAGVLVSLQKLRGIGEIAGMLYVVEGSALGGKVLLDVLGRSAGVTASTGASFFAPHGDNPFPRWGQYVQVLSGLANGCDIEQEVVFGARAAFSTLHDWIAEAWAS